jgi:hypothetical protein
MKLFFKKIGIVIISLVLVLTFILLFVISQFFTKDKLDNIAALSY